MRARPGVAEDLHFSCEQNDFAARYTARAGRKTYDRRQNRFVAAIHFQKGSAFLGSPEVGARQNRFSICRKEAACEETCSAEKRSCRRVIRVGLRVALRLGATRFAP